MYYTSSYDLPDHPAIRLAETDGYPDAGAAHCPICGKECETIYRDQHGEIFGCGECIRIEDAYDVDECFPDNERSN